MVVVPGSYAFTHVSSSGLVNIHLGASARKRCGFGTINGIHFSEGGRKMNPCAGCKKKGGCPEICYPKRDYERHMKKLNRKIRKNGLER